MVDNWKHYVMVIEKHVHILKSNNFKISIAVTLLTEEINKNVNALTVTVSKTSCYEKKSNMWAFRTAVQKMYWYKL